VESFSSSKPILNGTGFYETDYKNKMRLLWIILNIGQVKAFK
jgi:hypothetical protein